MYSRAGESWGKGWETPGNNWTRPTFPSSSQSSLSGQPRASLKLELVPSDESNPGSCPQGAGIIIIGTMFRGWEAHMELKGAKKMASVGK